MIWPFRKQKYKVCEVCGVHFEAISYSDPRWENLCETHREPVRDRAHRKDSVMEWASLHYERLYKVMEKERRDYEDQMAQMFRERSQAQCSAQQEYMNTNNIHGGLRNAP